MISANKLKKCGPWVLDKKSPADPYGHNLILDSEGCAIAAITQLPGANDIAELIAAAPELLTECTRLQAANKLLSDALRSYAHYPADCTCGAGWSNDVAVNALLTVQP